MLQRRSWDHSAFEHFDQQEGKNDRYGDAEQNHSDRVQNCGTERRMSSRLLKYPTFGLRELQSFKTPHPSPCAFSVRELCRATPRHFSATCQGCSRSAVPCLISCFP